MSARKEDRWQGAYFSRTVGRYTLTVWLSVRGPGWHWEVWGVGEFSQGVKPTERAAKLAARRRAERLMREEKGKR